VAALTDLSDVINRLTGGNDGTPEHVSFFKDNRIAGAAAPSTVAGRLTSLWRYSGSPSAASTPSAVIAPTRTTPGALAQANPGGGREKWLLGVEAIASAQGGLILYDRLLEIGELLGNSTSAQTVGGTLTRYTGAASVGNEIWIEIYFDIGSTATTITATYTDQDGNTGAVTPATPIGGSGLREATRIIALPLADGDTGVRGVDSVTLAATTGTAGNFGVTVARRLLYIPVGASGAGSVRDTISGLPSIPEIETDACLAWIWGATGTSAPFIMGQAHFIEK
jgi:hypothetical protein